MRPLLVHASSAATEATHRRVIDIDYASCQLGFHHEPKKRAPPFRSAPNTAQLKMLSYQRNRSPTCSRRA